MKYFGKPSVESVHLASAVVFICIWLIFALPFFLALTVLSFGWFKGFRMWEDLGDVVAVWTDNQFIKRFYADHQRGR